MADEADPICTFLVALFSMPYTSTSCFLTESKNPSISQESETVTTLPTSVMRCPSVPPVKPIPYLRAASRASWLDLRVIPLHMTS